MLTSRMTKKGQVTIPLKLRKQLGLSPGDEVEFGKQNKNKIIIFKRKNNIREAFGLVKVNRKVTLEEMEQAIIEGATDDSA